VTAGFDLAGIAYRERVQSHPECARDTLDCGELRGSPSCRILKHPRPHHERGNLFEQFQPFGARAEFGRGKASSVAPRPRHAFDEARADWLGDRYEHNRQRAARLLQRLHGWIRIGQDHVRSDSRQLSRHPANAAGVGRKSGIDSDVATDRPAEFLQSLQERPDTGLCFRIVRW